MFRADLVKNGNLWKAESYYLKPNKLTEKSELHWHSEMQPGKFFVARKENYLKRFDIESKNCYEGEVIPHNGQFLPHGKGVWTCYEPFNIKEGIFESGRLKSGKIEVHDHTVESDDIAKPLPKQVKLTIKSSGKVVEGIFKESGEFDGVVTIFVPKDSYYIGESLKFKAHGNGKLWNFKHKVFSEGKYVDGFLTEGVVVQVDPSETNLPERSFPDLQKLKLLSRYEGKMDGPRSHGPGKYHSFIDETTIEGHFEGGALHGPFKQTFKDGSWIEGIASQGQQMSGKLYTDPNTSFELLYSKDVVFAEKCDQLVKSAASTWINLVERNQFKMLQEEHNRKQSAQSTGTGQPNPDNKSNMMNKDKDWTLAEGWDAGRIPLQGGSGASSASFGVRLPFGFHSIWMNRMGALVNTQQQGLRAVASRPLMTPNSSILTDLRQPLLRFVCRRFKQSHFKAIKYYRV